NAPIAGATATNYTIPSASLGDNGAVFKVTASNTVDGVPYIATSSDALLTVNADTTPPTLLDVRAIGLQQVKVILSERVLAADASQISNYSINGGPGPITISSATIDAAQT